MKKKLVPVKEFARLCGVSAQTIYSRIANGEVSTVEIKGTSFIDLAENKIQKAKDAGRKPAESLLK